MEVLTIEHSAFQQLISKIDAMDEFIRKAKLEQQSSLDDDWVSGQGGMRFWLLHVTGPLPQGTKGWG